MRVASLQLVALVAKPHSKHWPHCEIDQCDNLAVASWVYNPTTSQFPSFCLCWTCHLIEVGENRGKMVNVLPIHYERNPSMGTVKR